MILAIIALIATPIIVGVINDAKKNAFEDTAYGILEAGKLYYAQKLEDNQFSGKIFDFTKDTSELKLSGQKPLGGYLEIDVEGNTSFAVYDQNKTWCAIKMADTSKVKMLAYDKNTCVRGYTIDDYVTEGLVVHYDGIYNMGKDTDHNNEATTWKNLASNTYDGILYNGASFVHNALLLDGKKAWVDIGFIDYPAITIEVVTEILSMEEIEDDYAPFRYEKIIIANYESGGYGINTYLSNESFRGGVFKKDGYKYITRPYTLHQKTYLSLRANTDTFLFNKNEEKLASTKNDGNPIQMADNTHLLMGGQPAPRGAIGSFYHGKIYAVRIYNRVLTDAEIKQNYQVDHNRFVMN